MEQEGLPECAPLTHTLIPHLYFSVFSFIHFHTHTHTHTQENRYNKTEQARFKEEVAILKNLQHPNILRLYDSWEITRHGDKKERKVLVLVTELMTSGTLKG